MKTNRSPSDDLETIIPLLINVWRRFHKQSGPPDKLQTREFRRVVACLQHILGIPPEKIKQETKEKEAPFTPRELLAANLLYPWIIHYQEGLSLIGEVPQIPRRVLDVCSGTGPFAFAALRHGASEVIATDKNVEALELAAEVAGRYGMPLTIRPWNCLKDPMPIEGSFDLITVGHALSDLFPANEKGWQEKQLRFVNYLLSRLKSTGYLLLVESSFLEDNRRLLEMRDQLVKNGVFMQAPCIWQGECPALKTPNSPCYAQREMPKPYLVKEIQRAAHINLSSLKMTYLLIRSPQAPKQPETDRQLYRVISPPIETYQGKRYYLCGTDAKKTLGSRLEELPKESRAFDFLRRGELIEIINPLEHGQAFDIVQGTEVIVRAACGKPVPNFEQIDDGEF